MGYGHNKLSVLYHDIFDYPLTSQEMVRWQVGSKTKNRKLKIKIKHKKGFYFIDVKNREKIIRKRLIREKYSLDKIKIAKKASNLLSKIHTVLFVGLTGSVAMKNAGKNSDIDLMIITKNNSLWLTRFLVYFVLRTKRYSLRRTGVKNEQDKLCLNMWLDETYLVWPKSDRNIYSAHEIAQIVPLVNKNRTFEKFLWKNKWILDYWPNAVKISNLKFKISNSSQVVDIFNKIAFKLQYWYMSKKITREVVSPNSAIFHPTDWSKNVLEKLNQ